MANYYRDYLSVLILDIENKKTKVIFGIKQLRKIKKEVIKKMKAKKEKELYKISGVWQIADRAIVLSEKIQHMIKAIAEDPTLLEIDPNEVKLGEEFDVVRRGKSEWSTVWFTTNAHPDDINDLVMFLRSKHFVPHCIFAASPSGDGTHFECVWWDELDKVAPSYRYASFEIDGVRWEGVVFV